MQDNPRSSTDRYWRSNLKLVFMLLIIWFACSYGAAILFVESLNTVTLAGFPLGFWFAHQGSILIFIILIAIYCIRMDRLDAAYADDSDSAPESHLADSSKEETSS